MRVVFLEIDSERSWAVASIGPAFIGAYLRARGHDVGFVRVGVDVSDDAVVTRIGAEQPGLLGVLAHDPSVAARTRRDRRHPREDRCAVIAGGLHPTFAPEAVLSASGFDYVCLGEGEEPMLDVVQALSSGIPVHGICPA